MNNDRNYMEMWLFDTCNFRCGYCALVTSGLVKETSQLKPFKEKSYIENLVRFFKENRPANRAWTVSLTGGEPMLMPNLDYFVSLLGQSGDKIAIYTNGSYDVIDRIGSDNVKNIEYIELSFHPDWHMGPFDEELFFGNAEKLVSHGVGCLVRFVGAPSVIDKIDYVSEKCKKIGVGFLPTTLFDQEYPRSYTTAEREKLSAAMSGYSSRLQLEGGVDMRGRKCLAADRIFAARLHQGGDITPCISTSQPVLGNIFDNKLNPIYGLKNCMKADRLCTCDIHFQQNIVDGAEDNDNFKRILNGERITTNDEYIFWKSYNKIVTTDEIWAGQGTTAYKQEGLVIGRKKVDKAEK